MLHKLSHIFILFFLLFPITALSSTPLKIGIIPIADVLPLYVAIDQGYMAEENIDVELVPLWSGSRIIAAMAGGSLDIGFSATLSILQAAEKGLDLMIIEPASFVRTDDQSVNALMVLKESGVTDLKDLKGKILGTNTISSIAWLLATEMLHRAGIKSDEVVWQEVSFPQMPAALEQKRIDAGWFVEPFLTIIEESQKVKTLGIGEKIIPGHSMASFCAQRKWIENNEKKVDAFDRACEKGIQFCLKNPNEARTILVKYTKIAPVLAKKITLHAYATAIDPEKLNQFQNLAKKHGLLNQGVDAKHILYHTAKGP